MNSDSDSIREHHLTTGTISDSDSERQALADRVLKLAVRSPYDGEEFFPRGCLDAIITHEAVWVELVAHGGRLPAATAQQTQEHLDSLAEFAVRRSKNIFAILICCNFSEKKLQQALAQFQSLGFDDSNLPVMLEESRSTFYSTENDLRKPWTSLSVHQFCSYQWKFLAPVFLDEETHMNLHSRTVLPFTKVEHHGNPASGTSSEVYGVTIHPAHRKHSCIQVKMSKIRADAFSIR